MQLLVRKNPDDHALKQSFIKYRNICNQIAKDLKVNYYNDKSRKNYKNNKGTWETVKELCNITKNHSQATALLNLLPSSENSLDVVNTYFTSIGEELASEIMRKRNTTESALLKKVQITKNAHSMWLYPTDFIEIDKIILHLKIYSSPGIDSIPTVILKNSHAILCSMIAHLCNLSISAGKFPAVFKKAVVVPIRVEGWRRCRIIGLYHFLVH